MDNYENIASVLWGNKDLIIAVLILVIVFIYYKSIKTAPEENSIKKKSAITKKINTNNANSEVDKLLENLSNLTEVAENAPLVDENTSYFSKKILDDHRQNFGEDDGVDIPTELMDDILLRAQEKLGSVAQYIQRIDSEGKIIIPLDALDFITRKHEPLITPDGTIRVLNLLTLEDELLESINKGKPIFYIDEKENSIKRIEPIMAKKLLTNSGEVTAIEELATIKKIHQELEQNNILLFNNNEEYSVQNKKNKEYIKELEDQVKELNIKTKTQDEVLEKIDINKIAKQIKEQIEPKKETTKVENSKKEEQIKEQIEPKKETTKVEITINDFTNTDILLAKENISSAGKVDSIKLIGRKIGKVKTTFFFRKEALKEMLNIFMINNKLEIASIDDAISSLGFVDQELYFSQIKGINNPVYKTAMLSISLDKVEADKIAFNPRYTNGFDIASIETALNSCENENVREELERKLNLIIDNKIKELE